ncbi:MAG: citryl-CoA lyase [Haloferacaceae archaeon]
MAFETSISTYDETSVELAGLDLTEEVMGELDFASVTYLLVTGERPTPGERTVLNGMLTSLIAHGVTPHAITTRLTLLTAPESIQGAVAAGLLGTGRRFLGSMEDTSRALARVTDPDGDLDDPDGLAAEYVASGRPFPGIGHPHHDPVDPRAQRLFDLADEHDVAGENVAALRAVQARLESETGASLPINVTGAIGAISADMGMPPRAARGIAMLSRAAGLIAEALEEERNPQAMGYWELIQEQTEYSPPER